MENFSLDKKDFKLIHALDRKTLLALHEAISRETHLIAYEVWDAFKTPCAMGALVPKEQRCDANRFVTNFNPKFNVYTLGCAVGANNDFTGTPAERRDFMLQWVKEQLAALPVEGSNLTIPEFTKTLAKV